LKTTSGQYYITRTDDQGEFELTNVKAGTYSLEIEPSSIASNITFVLPQSMNTCQLVLEIFETNDSVAIDQDCLLVLEEKPNELTIFPNPVTSGTLHIMSPNTSIVQVELLTIDGRNITPQVTFEGNQLQLDLKHALSGLHLLRIIRNGRTEIHKILIQQD
jgi:hypothetical protein